MTNDQPSTEKGNGFKGRPGEIQPNSAREYTDTILRTIRTSLLVLDAEFRIKTMNRAFCQRFVTSDEPVIGRRLFDFSVGRWDRGRLRERLQKTLSENDELVDYELKWEPEDAEPQFFSINANAVMGVNREPLIVMSIEDISHRRLDELASRRQRDELVAEQARKNEFLAMLGHELRNPLAAMTFSVEVLAAAEDPQKRQAAYATATRQLQRMTSLLDQLLEMGRLATGKITLELKPVDMVEVVRSAVEVIEPLVHKHRHDLEVSLPPDRALLVCGDANRLAQVIENLLTNSAKYTEDGGQITASLYESEQNVVFRLQDTGVGMSPELLVRVFDPFVQARRTLARSEGGLGLGLPLAKHLVELHGGELTAHSPGLGQGSTFAFTLPLLSNGPELQAAEHPDDARAGRPAPHPWRILIIDDEADISNFFAEILRTQGYQVEVATDGLRGIEVARDFQPRVILLDLGLPDMDGYAVAHRLREDFADQPLFMVAITGYQKDDKKLQAAGFDEHLLKPPDIDLLLEWVDALE